MKAIAIAVVALSVISARAAAAWQDRPVAASVAEDVASVHALLYSYPFGICDHEDDKQNAPLEKRVCGCNDAGNAKLLHQIYARRLSKARSKTIGNRVWAAIERVRGLPEEAADRKEAAEAFSARAAALEIRVGAVERVLLDSGWAVPSADGLRYSFQQGVDWAIFLD